MDDDHRADRRHRRLPPCRWCRQARPRIGHRVLQLLLSNIDYRSLVKVWPVHVAVTWGMVLPTLFIRNVTVGPLTIGYNAGDTDNYSWYKLGGFTLQPTELAKISFILTFAMHLNNVRGQHQRAQGAGQAAAASWLVPILIIHIQGDDGTAIIYGIIGCCMMFCRWLELEVYHRGHLGGGRCRGRGVRLFQR